jgi:hypothetical protein
VQVERWLSVCLALNGLRAAVPGGAALRVVQLSSQHLGSLSELLWALSNHPRVQFVVAVRGTLELGLAQRTELVTLMSGYDGVGWPPNVLLIAGFDAPLPDDLAAVFEHQVLIPQR